MKNQLIAFAILICSSTIFAQKIIEYPDYISSNVSGKVTKVERTDNQTILHFNIDRVGSWIYIPSKTYIEDALGKGERLYIDKTDGILMDQKINLSNSEDISYKLYFPALGKNVKKINFGESNPGGNWFIFKLDISKDGTRYSGTKNVNIFNKLFVKEGESVFNLIENNRKLNSSDDEMSPNDLPKEFFGNWYDKYGTLILITTPDFIVSNFRVQYYSNIQKTSQNKFNIRCTDDFFQILNLDSKTMVIRTDKLISLKRKPINNTVPRFLKGDWLNKNNNKITIKDDFFYFDSDTSGNMFGDKKRRIVHTAGSDSNNVIWFVLYNQGSYTIYIVRKIDGEYVLSPRDYMNTQYVKK